MHNTQKTVVISVGGSLVVPDSIDVNFLKALKELLLRHIQNGYRFAIIVGGGRTSRAYQTAARACLRAARKQVVTPLSSEDIDWLGIHATRLNAHLLRSVFVEEAEPVIVKDPTAPVSFEKPILIAAGWKPGWSTDYDAVLLAQNIGARSVVNLTNVDYVYDKDPREHRDAKPIKEIGWSDFRKLLPEKWDPGLHTPFDPIAAREAEKLGLTAIIMNGKNLAELDKYIEERDFTGTIIK